MFHTSRLNLHLSSLGFAVNWKKSSPHPLQRVGYLGVVERLHQGTAVMALTVM